MRGFYMIQRMKMSLFLVFIVLVLLSSLSIAEELYEENDWNFVDKSMDVSSGIPDNASGRLLKIKKAGQLRVATEPYFPPQEFLDPSKSGQESIIGADIDLAKLIAERMQVDLVLVPMEFTEVLPSVADGECDLAISGLAYTPGRASQVELSKGYHYTTESTGSGLLIRSEDAERITGIGDLSDKKICAQSGSLQESLLAENVHTYHEFLRLPSVSDVYTALINKTVDAVCVDFENAYAYIENNPGCELMVLPDVSFVLNEHFDGDRIAAKKGETMLIAFVNGVIDEILDEYPVWFDDYGKIAAELGL